MEAIKGQLEDHLAELKKDLKTAELQFVTVRSATYLIEIPNALMNSKKFQEDAKRFTLVNETKSVGRYVTDVTSALLPQLEAALTKQRGRSILPSFFFSFSNIYLFILFYFFFPFLCVVACLERLLLHFLEKFSENYSDWTDAIDRVAELDCLFSLAVTSSEFLEGLCLIWLACMLKYQPI